MQNVKNDLLNILKDINDSIELQENQLEKNYKMISSYIKSDNIDELLKEFEVYTENSEQENRCQEIIKLLLSEISKQEEQIKTCLSSYSFIEYPDWVDSLDILKEENCIVNYIQESVYCFKEADDGNNYLITLKGKDLKEELISYIDKETQSEYLDFYQRFSEDDYNKAIEFVKIDMNNDKISELNYDLEQLARFTTLLKLFDYHNIRNVYVSSLINLVTAMSEPIQNIIKQEYSDVLYRGNKLTSALISLKIKHPECFEIDGEDKYVDIMEIIERRNMYIHNQGLVNDKYLNFNTIIHSSVWNVQGFIDGDLLQIDSYYFQDSYSLFEAFIKQL